jgi:hypothetical protein
MTTTAILAASLFFGSSSKQRAPCCTAPSYIFFFLDDAKRYKLGGLEKRNDDRTGEAKLIAGGSSYIVVQVVS